MRRRSQFAIEDNFILQATRAAHNGTNWNNDTNENNFDCRHPGPPAQPIECVTPLVLSVG